MFGIGPNVDFGAILALSYTDMTNGSFVYSSWFAGAVSQLQIQGTGTFHNASSVTVAITVEVDQAGFEIETDLAGGGVATEHTIDPSGGGAALAPKITLQTEGASRATKWRLGVKTNGVAVSGDSWAFIATGSAF